MHRTNTVELVTNKEQRKMLLEMMVLSSCIWNMANYNFRQSIINKTKVNSFFTQKHLIQNTAEYQKLGRCYSGPKLLTHSFVVNGYFGSLRAKIKVGLPKYYKNRNTNTTIPTCLCIESEGYYFQDNKVHLPLSHQMRRETKLKGIILEYKGILRWKGKQCQGEIRYNKINKKFYFHQPIEIKEPKQRTGRKFLAIDIGIKRGMVGFDNKKAFIYSNPIIKEWKQITKRITRLQRIAKNRNGVNSSNQIRRLFRKRTRLVDNYYKNIASWIIKDSNPNKIIIGDVQGILNRPGKIKTLNQTAYNFWSFNLLYKRLENKCQEKGIELVKVPEPYTSQLCPACGQFNDPVDRKYECNCGYKQDRDINGAINIYYQNIGRKVCLYPVVENHHLFIKGSSDERMALETKIS